MNLGATDEPGEVDLFAERHDVRQSAKRNTYTGKTYNSIENISQFSSASEACRSTRSRRRRRCRRRRFRGRHAAEQAAHPGAAAGRKAARTGMTVEHPKYGTGTVVRREGDGEDAKITVNFPRYGLKKLVEKYAGLKRS